MLEELLKRALHAAMTRTGVLKRIFAAALLMALTTSARADFALRDGDTVVFLGDSITAAGGYTKVIENYTLLRYPARKVRFINAGLGGDTAMGGLKRLERDVFDQGATVVTVAFGVNDIGWGMKADAEHKQRYLDGVRGIVNACRERKVRVFVCSPAITAEEPDRAERGFLQTMTDEGLALARSLGAETIAVQRGMREIQRQVIAANAGVNDPRKMTALHLEDAVHLSDLGQLAMAFVILKGLGAPADVSSVAIDASTGKLIAAEGCRVSGIKCSGDDVQFVRLDEGLPLNLGILGGLNFRFVPIPDGLSRYMLTVRNLPAGDYEIRAEGRLLGKVPAKRLHEGLNISSLTADGWEPGGPWDAQAGLVKELTDARDKVWTSDALRNRFLGNHPQDGKLDRRTAGLEREIVDLQRATTRPYPYHFEIRKAVPPLSIP